MKSQRLGWTPRRGDGLESRNTSAPLSITAPAVPSNEVEFIHREECRKCPAMVWVSYYFVDGDDAGWGVLPIDRCQSPDRCGEKVRGVDSDDLVLAWCPVAGRA